MKKIIITRENDELAIFPSLEDMLTSSKGYIGFTPDNNESKYIIVKCGSARGLAINPEGTWSSAERQSKISGDYYLFDDKRELYEWLIEDE